MLRIILILASVVTVLSVIYKWRYRLVNTFLAVSFLRKVVVAVMMNMPAIKQKILPRLWNKTASPQ